MSFPPDAPNAENPGGFTANRLAQQIEFLTPRLLAWVRCKLTGRQRIDPQDLVQEAWCRAVTRLDSFEGDDDSFAGWLFRIQKLVLLEYLRATSRWSKVRIAEGRSTIEAALHNAPAALTTLTRRLARDEQLEAFMENIAQLDPDDRTLFELCALERVSREEAAQRTGLSRAAVTKRWQRLRARLAEANAPADLLE